MVTNTKCDKCGDLMTNNIIQREDCVNSAQFHCSACGYYYESGLRYNRLIKQHVKYMRFYP